jgi:hypothetical protein
MKVLKEPILIVFSVLLFFLIYGLVDIKIFSERFNLKKVNLKPFLKPALSREPNLIDRTTRELLQTCTIQMDTTPQRILLTGDSMVEGLMYAFKDYAIENGHELFPAIWYSSSTLVWGSSQQLKKLIDYYKPTIIFFALGSNELFIRNIIQDRAQYVDSILSQVGNIKFIWIGPPNWKPDTGINELLETKLGKRRFFSSKELKLARASDGAHPTRAASRIWADSILHWVQTQSLYPFLLKKPQKNYGKSPNCVFIDGNYPQ